MSSSQQPGEVGAGFCAFYRWRNWGLERLSVCPLGQPKTCKMVVGRTDVGRSFKLIWAVKRIYKSSLMIQAQVSLR